jgi:hypothetical protein
LDEMRMGRGNRRRRTLQGRRNRWLFGEVFEGK